MEVTEFRIGNLFTTVEDTHHYSREVEVEFLTDNNNDLDGPLVCINGYEENQILGITMTKEKWSMIGEHKDILVDKVGFVIFKNQYGHQFMCEDYPFMHQVQNLYFALKGEELEMK